MAHPEEPTLPEDTGQRKNKNINNVLHDISRFLLSEIHRRAFLSPRSVKQYKKVTAMDAKLEQPAFFRNKTEGSNEASRISNHSEFTEGIYSCYLLPEDFLNYTRFTFAPV